MDLFLNMLPMLLSGMAIVMAGFLFKKKSELSLYSVKESVAWGIGFFLSFSAETLLIGFH